MKDILNADEVLRYRTWKNEKFSERDPLDKETMARILRDGDWAPNTLIMSAKILIAALERDIRKRGFNGK